MQTARQVSASGAGIRVVCRLRPMNEREKMCNTVPAVSASTERKEVAVARVTAGGTRQQRSSFHFDEVLTSFSTQSEVFAATLEPLVAEVLSGYEATAFAYGQTGTGKTYTMEGNLDSDEGRGMVPRAAAAVIGALSSGDYSDFSVTVSYLEIYNEELSDLLAPAQLQQKLDLKDVGNGRVMCIGLSEVQVSSVSDILTLVHRAQERRRVAETRVNARSSRSHSIFTMKVRCRRAVGSGELENTGKLHLVDLAGSECAKKAASLLCDENGNAPQARMSANEEERERRNINQSLLTLGRVIQALREASSRVPYRDSKLTRLLQDALGGRCKTVIIATISPALASVEETISTLTYAEQACGIKNKPVASSLLRSIRMAANGDGATSANMPVDFQELELRVAYLAQEVEEAQMALARQFREAQDANDRAAGAEERLSEAEANLRKQRQSCEEQCFMRERLASFADDRVVATKRFDIALKATVQHGENLERLLSTQLASARESRLQGKEACSAAEENAVALAEVIKSKCKETTAVVREVNQAQKAYAREFEFANEERKRCFSQLAQDSAAESDRSLSASGVLVAEAVEVLTSSSAQASQALDAIEAASEAAGTAASQLSAAVDEAVSKATESSNLQSKSISEDIRSAKQKLSSKAETAGEELQAAARAADESFTASQEHLQSGIRSPLEKLLQDLRTALEANGCHGKAVGHLHSSEAAAAEASAERWAEVLSALASLVSSNSSRSSENAEATGTALTSLQQCLDVAVKATSGPLDKCMSELSSSAVTLQAAVEAGEAAVQQSIGHCDKALRTAWSIEASSLDTTASTLAAALERQEASNAAVAMRRDADSAAGDLAAVLTTEIAALAAARSDVAGQVLELQQQRAAEQQLLDVVRSQRTSLEADVAALQQTLNNIKDELAAGQVKLSQLKSSQEARRQKARDAISRLVQEELDYLGEDLCAGVSLADGILSRSTDLAIAAGQKAAMAMEKNQGLGNDAGALATTWSQSVAASCKAIEEAQRRSGSAAESVRSAGDSAQTELRSLGAEATSWGEACDEVVKQLDAGSRVVVEMKQAMESLIPHWDSARQQTLDASSHWADGSRNAKAALDAAAVSAGETEQALQSLQRQVSESCTQTKGLKAAWLETALSHSKDIQTVSLRVDDLKVEEARHSECLVQALQDLRLEAASMEDGCSSQVSQARVLVKAASTQITRAEPEHDALATALRAGEANFQELKTEAEAILDRAQGGQRELQETQLKATGRISEHVAGAHKAISCAAEAASTHAKQQRTAGEAATKKSTELFRQAEAGQKSFAKAICEAVERAGSAAHSVGSVGRDRIQAELENGGKAVKKSESLLDALSGYSVMAIGKHQAELRAALAREPLAVFVECLSAVPARPEAFNLNIELLERPADDELLREYSAARRSDLQEVIEPMRENIAPCWAKAVEKSDSEILKVHTHRRVLGEVGNRHP